MKTIKKSFRRFMIGVDRISEKIIDVIGFWCMLFMTLMPIMIATVATFDKECSDWPLWFVWVFCLVSTGGLLSLWSIGWEDDDEDE